MLQEAYTTEGESQRQAVNIEYSYIGAFRIAEHDGAEGYIESDTMQAYFLTAAGNFKRQGILEQIGRAATAATAAEMIEAALEWIEEGNPSKMIEKALRRYRVSVAATKTGTAEIPLQYEIMQKTRAATPGGPMQIKKYELSQYLRNHADKSTLAKLDAGSITLEEGYKITREKEAHT